MRTSSSSGRNIRFYEEEEEEKRNLLSPVFDHATIAVRSLRRRVRSIARRWGNLGPRVVATQGLDLLDF